MEPSDEFKQRLLEPIEALFQGAMDSHRVSPSMGGRNHRGVELPIVEADFLQPTTEKKRRPHRRKVDDRAFEAVVMELSELVGLDIVKDRVRSLACLARIEGLRRERNLPVTEISLHFVFAGNPGTGKTTVARLVSRIMHALGFLSSGHLVEVDKSQLVGGYMGQTPGIVAAKVDEARGGVLFIDEAYSLADDDQDMYGREAVSGLVKAMEDQREDLIVIFAGYPDKMRKFISTNPGLRSRVGRWIDFGDYSPAQLHEIFILICRAKGLLPSPGLLFRSELTWEKLSDRGVTSVGNGRMVRTAFEVSLENQARRLSGRSEIATAQVSELVPADWDGVAEILEEVYDA